MDLTQITIRPPIITDATAMIAYMVRLTNEPNNNISLDPGQFTYTEEQERAFIESVQDPTQTICLVAEHQGRIIAIAQLSREKRPTRAHVAILGISIDQDYRHQGLGTKLMNLLLDWAKAQQIKRIELKVFARNEPAIKLYKKLGFQEEGRHPHAFIKQGQPLEDVSMAMLL